MQRIRWTLTVALVAVGLVALVGGGGAPAQAQSDLPVGVLLPFSGQYAWVGGNVMPVVQMIAEEVGETGGIDGANIRLIQGDTEGTVDAGASAAQKLVNVDQVRALVGPTSLSFTGVKQIIQDNGVPMVSPTAGTTELNEAGTRYFYRTVPSDNLGARAIARAVTAPTEYMSRDAAFENVVLMVGQAPALISFRDPISDAMDSYGQSLAKTVEYQTGKASYRSEVGQALDAEPDAIILVGSPEDSVRLMQNAFEAGYDGTWVVTQDQTNADFLNLAGQLAEGIYGLQEVPSAGPERLDAFEQRLQEFAGVEAGIFATNAYDAANVLFLAMLRAQLRDGEVTRDAIERNIKQVANPGEGKTAVTDFTEGQQVLEDGGEVNYEGLVGPTDFDEYGNIAAPFGILQAQSGEWSTVSTIEADDIQ